MMKCRSEQTWIAHDAITHPEHPLHIEGVKGIQLYHGNHGTPHKYRCSVTWMFQVHSNLEKLVFYSLPRKWNMYDTGSTRWSWPKHYFRSRIRTVWFCLLNWSMSRLMHIPMEVLSAVPSRLVYLCIYQTAFMLFALFRTWTNITNAWRALIQLSSCVVIYSNVFKTSSQQSEEHGLQ